MRLDFYETQSVDFRHILEMKEALMLLMTNAGQ